MTGCLLHGLKNWHVGRLFSCCGSNHSLLSLTECSHAPFLSPHTYIQAVPGLFAALARKRLDRDMLLDKTRLVLAEKDLEVTKARAEKEREVTKARAEKEREVSKKDLEVTKARAEKEREVSKKDLEVTKARADARVATADARAATADARAATADSRAAMAELETT